MGGKLRIDPIAEILVYTELDNGARKCIVTFCSLAITC